MKWQRLNFGFRDIPYELFKDGDSFFGCNFARWTPHTSAFVGLKNLTFLGETVLINCDLPKTAEVEQGCNIAQNEYEEVPDGD